MVFSQVAPLLPSVDETVQSIAHPAIQAPTDIPLGGQSMDRCSAEVKFIHQIADGHALCAFGLQALEFLSESPHGLPRCFPAAFAACIPSRWRYLTIERSN